jgi:Type III restriction enzyme, res subunit/Helicase conserved C-terminal domain
VAIYKYKTKPRNFQVRALKKMLKPKGGGNFVGGALWMPMRSGKTKVAIDFCCVLKQKYGVKKVLVLTHSVTTIPVWRAEWAKHAPIDYVLSTSAQPDFPKNAPFQVLVLNIQRVFDREKLSSGWQPAPNKALYKWKPDVVIVDEATCVGDPGAVQTAHLYRLVTKLGIRFVLELTGTPVHRKIWGAFGQFKILDDSVFGTALGAYKTKYGEWGGYDRKKLLRLRRIKTWRRKVEPYVFQMFRIPFRKPIEIIIPVELSDKTRNLHDRMEKESIVKFKRKGQTITVTAPIPLTRALKCAQIAAGFVRDDDGTWHVVGTDLRDSFASTVQDLADSEVKRIVVFAKHIPELRAAALACKAAGYRTLLLHGGVEADKREQRIAAFHDPGGYKAFISQVATGSMGIDLSAADTTLYYTLPQSLLHKDQADARIRLHGDKRPLTYYYFIPEGTYLEVMKLALKEGMDMAQYIAHHPDIIHHLERE